MRRGGAEARVGRWGLSPAGFHADTRAWDRLGPAGSGIIVDRRVVDRPLNRSASSSTDARIE
jgi:hypothetical protein